MVYKRTSLSAHFTDGYGKQVPHAPPGRVFSIGHHFLGRDLSNSESGPVGPVSQKTIDRQCWEMEGSLGPELIRWCGGESVNSV